MKVYVNHPAGKGHPRASYKYNSKICKPSNKKCAKNSDDKNRPKPPVNSHLVVREAVQRGSWRPRRPAPPAVGDPSCHTGVIIPARGMITAVSCQGSAVSNY